MANHVFSLLGLAIAPREIGSLKIEPKRFIAASIISCISTLVCSSPSPSRQLDVVYVSSGSTQAIGPQERLFKLDE
jgi:hypothetical protein